MLSIGNAQGFWGDRVGMAEKLLLQYPALDFITMDYLAEVSLSILARQKVKDPKKGYPQDLLDEVWGLIPHWKNGSRCKLVTNGGGLNPLECGLAITQLLREADLKELRVGVVYGDDVMVEMEALSDRPLVSANAYLGGEAIAKLLDRGADIVVTGRSADPSLVVGCCVHHFKWSWDDYHRLAAATIAGHLIECGTQVTGGILTDWLSVPEAVTMGYPIVEMEESGIFTVTKPTGSGGCVSELSVKEQLLYEIGDPERYLSPDVTVSFTGLKLEKSGENRIKISGARGQEPPKTYKVSATFEAGYRAEGSLTLFGHSLKEKAEKCGNVVFERVKEKGFELENTLVECIGAGDVTCGVVQPKHPAELCECVVRFVATDSRKEAVECFAREIIPLVTSGPQGTTGYFGGRPKVRPVYGYEPMTISKEQVKIETELLQVKPS